MSCGDPHSHDCSEILAKVIFFIDKELDDASYVEIAEHLDECGPCLAEYDLERTVKTLIARSCTEQAPADLRAKVMMRIEQVQVTFRD